MALTNELKVGMFVIAAGGLAAFFTNWSLDGIRGGEKTYTLHLSVPSADGMWEQSGVKLAGVDIGAVGDIRVAGDHAELDLLIRDEYQLPTDSMAEIRSTGIIGDRYIGIILGDDPTMLKDGDWIRLRSNPADFEKITKQVEDITEDVAAITQVLREMAEDDTNRDNVESTIANVEALSDELRLIAQQNHQDINAIVDSVRRLSETLEAFAKETQSDVDEEMEKLKETTDALNRTVADIESVTGKIDDGEGTIGALVNDRETVDLLNETIDNANGVIEGFSGMHTEVYYVGRYYFGTQPADPVFFYGNPLAGGGANTVGLKLAPQEDFWYSFEIVDYPQGTVTYVEHFFPESGQVYTEWIREPDYRMTFMMHKRWRSLGLRLGVKEDGGGLGATIYMFDDKLELQGDIFDFDLGAYPAVIGGPQNTGARGIPNVRILGRYAPMEHVYVELGTEQILLGLKYQYATGFFGAGFHFNDDDIKLLFATLPLGF